MTKLGWILIGTLTALAAPAHAQNVETGRVMALYADPGTNPDLVVELDRRGRCGSTFYHINRYTNFDQAADLAKIAFAHDKKLIVWIIGCNGDRHRLSHVAVAR
jgi:hypothetical protein